MASSQAHTEEKPPYLLEKKPVEKVFPFLLAFLTNPEKEIAKSWDTVLY